DASPLLPRRTVGWTNADLCESASTGWKCSSPPNTTEHYVRNFLSPSRHAACWALLTTGPTFTSALRGFTTFVVLNREETASPKALRFGRGAKIRRIVVHFCPAFMDISFRTYFMRSSQRSLPVA